MPSEHRFLCPGYASTIRSVRDCPPHSRDFADESFVQIILDEARVNYICLENEMHHHMVLRCDIPREQITGWSIPCKKVVCRAAPAKCRRQTSLFICVQKHTACIHGIVHLWQTLCHLSDSSMFQQLRWEKIRCLHLNPRHDCPGGRCFNLRPLQGRIVGGWITTKCTSW